MVRTKELGRQVEAMSPPDRTMLRMILPADVEIEECFGETSGGLLFPEEEKIIAHAVEARRREYAVVRSCARTCLKRLGYPRVPILPGAGGEPMWPAGVQGSMTHCAGYAAAAVGLLLRISAIGIDAEPDAPLSDGVVDLVATPAERDRLAGTQPERGILVTAVVLGSRDRRGHE
jgi:4'-phosphopantetheinyl transferase EntD